LARSPRVLLLDEASSNVDFETDAKIQATIRESFASSTLLTVAHRLRTVIDYDRILVLEKGQVAEFDTPASLIDRDGSIFRSMCQQTGEFDTLRDIAHSKASSH
ncbi:P-loop containing nucleoside triphosphate hydrolase protein, partial [Ramicandelaber brevisporus]